MITAKQRLEDLGFLGGTPAFGEPLYVGRPNLPSLQRFNRRVKEIFDRRWLTNNGPLVQEFEQRLAEYLGVKHCVAMCNGTIALETICRALDLKGEVIVPSLTFVATAHALQWQQITPVFCDIDPHTHNLDPEKVAASMTPRTTGIIGVHLWGRPCDVEALQVVADRHGLAVIYDAAHALGSTYEGVRVGNFGRAEVFSFHATKFFHTFEGGAITTNDDQLADKLRLMRNFGFAGFDNVIYIGINGKMSEISAAMGLSLMDEGLERLAARNRANCERYWKGVKNLPGVDPVRFNGDEVSNHQYVVLEIDAEKTGLTRDQIMTILHGEGVIARRYFYPGVHQMEPYRSLYPNAGESLPATEALVKKLLVLPSGSVISDSEIDTICHLIRFVLDHAGELSPLLPKLNIT
ncbi:aminotransferase class I/II-fold pyridoxal phosphate-dependent enzyme [Candidatus Neomarinimicrobiota bacterium]